MSRRADFMAQAQAARTMDIKKDNDDLTSVDTIVKEIGDVIEQKPAVSNEISDKETKKVSAPKSVEPVMISEEDIKISPDLIKNLRPKEIKSAHLNLLVSETLRQKITVLAKQRGVSINTLVNEILTNAFE